MLSSSPLLSSSPVQSFSIEAAPTHFGTLALNEIYQSIQHVVESKYAVLSENESNYKIPCCASEELWQDTITGVDQPTNFLHFPQQGH
jgi:hypothetical protein